MQVWNGSIWTPQKPGNSRSCQVMARWRLLYFGIRKVCCLLISWKGVQQLIQPCMLQHWNMYKLPSHILACWDKVSCSSMIMLSHTWPLYFENSCNILGGRNWSMHLIVLTWHQVMFISSQLSVDILTATDFWATRKPKQRRHSGSVSRTPHSTRWASNFSCA